MADPDIPLLPEDLRFEDRGGCLVLVDPAREIGRDVGAMWPSGDGRFVVRFGLVRPTSEPLPVLDREPAMRLLLNAYSIFDPEVVARLDEQRPRFSFGAPQIMRV